MTSAKDTASKTVDGCTEWLGYPETCLEGNTNSYLVLAELQIQELATTASVHQPMEVLPGPKDTHPVIQEVGKAFAGMSVCVSPEM